MVLAAFPHAAEMALAVAHGGALGPCDDDDEFEFALDFILYGLRRLQGSRGTTRASRRLTGS